MSQRPMTEDEAVKALEALAKRWPKSLWLFSNGSLCVMRKNKAGARATLWNGSMDPQFVVATIGIESDGGDW